MISWMPSSFYSVALPFLRAIYPPYLCTETVYLSKVPYIRHITFFCSWEGIFERGAIFGRIATLVGPLHSRFQRKTKNNRYFRGAISFGIVGIHHWFTWSLWLSPYLVRSPDPLYAFFLVFPFLVDSSPPTFKRRQPKEFNFVFMTF